MKIKILSIGDIHGRDVWKFLTHGSLYEYNTWRIACDHGAEANSDFWKEMPYQSFDKIIFVGDYVDSFTVGNTEMKGNLLDIIHFKKTLGDKVVLLLGNHDVQYIVPNQKCSGYRPEMQYDFAQIFNENLSLFKMAHEEVCKDSSRYLWTHAGVTSGWLENFHKVLFNPSRKILKPIIEEHDPRSKTISENLNFAWDLRMEILFSVDRYSGGNSEWAGPLWVRPRVLNSFPVKNYSQVVGHTPQGCIWIVDEFTLGKENPGIKHYFIDCIEYNGLVSEYKGLEIEIEV